VGRKPGWCAHGESLQRRVFSGESLAALKTLSDDCRGCDFQLEGSALVASSPDFLICWGEVREGRGSHRREIVRERKKSAREKEVGGVRGGGGGERPVVDDSSLGDDLSELIFCHEHLRQLEASCVVYGICICMYMRIYVYVCIWYMYMYVYACICICMYMRISRRPHTHVTVPA
jgi:hypothetical protein